MSRRRLADTLPQGSDDQPSLDEAPLHLGPRYALEHRIEVGGMGEVWQATDQELHRRVIIKIVRSNFDEAGRQRFRAEAEAVAGLQHPGIVPVYDNGTAADGRPFFVMRPVEGSPLSKAIERLHTATTDGRWRAAADGTSLHRLIDHLRRAAQAIAFAHDRGVLHCDIKPANILIGRFGEVEVADWGLAQRPGAIVGQGYGTPHYLSPEAARGEAITPAVDVWGLGACLYEVLTGGPPWPGDRAGEIQARASRGTPSTVPREGAPPIPPPLASLLAAALTRDPALRTLSAQAFSEGLGAWLEQAGRQEAALRFVAEADRRLQEAQAHDQEALRLEIQAQRRLASFEGKSTSSRPDLSTKMAVWAIEDQARAATQEAGRVRADAVAGLLAAVAQDPDCTEAHDSLSDLHRAAHHAARARGAWEEAAQAARLVEIHGPQRHRAWIAAESRLTLHTHPPALVALRTYRETGRILLPGPPIELGTTPLVDVNIPSGSHCLTLTLPDGTTGLLPIEAPRGEAWAWGPDPDGGDTLDLRPLRDTPPGCRTILASAYHSGRDKVAFSLPDRRYWVSSFHLQEHPVTNRDWIAFLDALVAAGDEELALRCAPRNHRYRPGDPSGLLYARHPDGGFCLTPDPEGDLWEPDWPVIFIDASAAEHYARWRTAQDGRPWRLPSEVEWEKAARGADGRIFPWGNHLDGEFTCHRESPKNAADRRLMASVYAFPIDTSPYGLRGLSGNTRGWCLEAWRDDGPPVDAHGRLLRIPGGDGPRAVRGAAYNTSPLGVRAAHRSLADAADPRESIGLRLACDLPSG